MMSEHENEYLPIGTIVVTGNDVGRIEAVTIEVDGKPVCRIHPNEVITKRTALMGRFETTMEFTTGQPVEYRPA